MGMSFAPTIPLASPCSPNQHLLPSCIPSISGERHHHRRRKRWELTANSPGKNSCTFPSPASGDRHFHEIPRWKVDSGFALRSADGTYTMCVDLGLQNLCGGAMIVQNSVITLMPKPLFSVSMCGKQINSDWPNCLQTGCQTSNSEESCFDHCSQYTSEPDKGKDIYRNDSTPSTSSGLSNVKGVSATPKSRKFYFVYNRKKRDTRCNYSSSVHSGVIISNEHNHPSAKVRKLPCKDLCMDRKMSVFDSGSIGERDLVLTTEPDHWDSLNCCAFTIDSENDALGAMFLENPISTMPKNIFYDSLWGNLDNSVKSNCVEAGYQTSNRDDHFPNQCLEYVSNVEEATDYAVSRIDAATGTSSGSSNLEGIAANQINGKSCLVYCRRKQHAKCNFSSYKHFGVSFLSQVNNANDQVRDLPVKDLQSDTPLKMLICLHCREAFHLFCGVPEGEKIEEEKRYCDRCKKRRPKPVLGVSKRGNPMKILNKISGYNKKLRSGSSLMSIMLEGTEACNSGVCIGAPFQAEVPEWSGPTISDIDSFGQPDEIEIAESLKVLGWNTIPSARGKSIGNWLQCREVIFDNTKGVAKEVVCGKWRRAPLFETQTDDWDCSCCVVWDPIHADCAVPQEISTEEVMLHLKYVKLLKQPYADKKRKKFEDKIGCPP